MKTTYHHGLIIAFLSLWAATNVQAQTPRIDPKGIDGALLLCGRGYVSDAALAQFIEAAGGDQAKIVILAPPDAKRATPFIESLNAAAKKKDAGLPRFVHVKDAHDALRNATGVWFLGDSAETWRKELTKHALARECRELLKRGGVIAASGGGAEMFASLDVLALLPDSMIETRAPAQGKSRLPEVLKKMPRSVGYQIDPGAALMVKGRLLRAIGERRVAVYLPEKGSSREIVLQGKRVEDLTALRRAARDRADGFPPKKVETPVVERGTLVIVGGGGSPKGLSRKFVEYAGGTGKAVIVIFPTAAANPLPKREFLAAGFRKAGAKKATVLYGQTQAEVESKPFLDALKEATGIWFDGGRQWRFVDCYENTKALPLMFDVLKRGGVIGGTSAGATIQGDYLARGGVFDNFDIAYPGYERGLGFLKGVAIDQHFTQRKRQKDMTRLMKTCPQYLGIGLDEATAIVVKGSIADVIGKGKAHFYDSRRKFDKGDPDYEALPAGGRYDLKTRRVLSAPNDGAR
ncbi:MAG: Type 1 glutamine amidotransferase-like domain-containing protein [Planctomycetes bacterium]|jgi:cyanophycinase|nr:Type 1 glutamine amidotransferase-like domain-containing protein [Planctomycetota bacterium]